MILHVDMDAYYASIEQRDHPELRGRPVIVGGTPEHRGVVCAASYEARRFGVHSAMPAARARRLCPEGVFLPSRMSHYAQVSDQIRDIFLRFTPLVEPLSLDEAFLDTTGSQRLFGSSEQIGWSIKQAIQNELGLVASVGVAPNKFLAKLASDLDKPDGFVVVQPEEIQAFLDPLPVGRLWGVGRVTGSAIEKLGVRTIGQLRQLPQEILREKLGDHGAQLWQLAHGIDARRVLPDREAKSISHETTFAEDVADSQVLRAWLVELSEQVAWRLRRHQSRARTVHIKVRFHDFRTVTRAESLSRATNVTQEILEAVQRLFDGRMPTPLPPVRLLGVGVSSIGQSCEDQRSLLDEERHRTQQKLDAAADQIRQRFGRHAVGRAARLEKRDA